MQEIRKVKGLISLNELIEIVEFQSNLFLFDSEGQLTKLDINGTLISQVKLDAKDMAASDNRIWLLQQNELNCKGKEKVLCRKLIIKLSSARIIALRHRSTLEFHFRCRALFT